MKDLVEVLAAELRPGVAINVAHAKVLEAAKEKNSLFSTFLSRTFGCGIGLNLKESDLEISAENETLIKEGMVFAIRLSLTGFNDEASRATLLLGDTIVVGAEKNQVVTEGISKKYQDISYVLDDEEDDDKEIAQEANNVILEKRTRNN